MSVYRWRGHTRRHEAFRRWADAQWEHDQRVHAQSHRRGRAVVDVTSPVPTTARPWQPTEEAAA